MTDPVVAGIDAGGTKTRAFVTTRAGEVVGRGAGGGANLLSSPDPQGAIAAAVHSALDGRRPSAVVLSCAGGDRPQERERGKAILAALFADVPIDVTHDAQAALYAGNPQGCGVVLIAGTGSIAYGRNAEGDEGRAGGWGHLIGDEGSSAWIGLEGLRAAAHAVDGRGAPTAIVPHVLRELGVAELADVLPIVYARPPAPALVAAARAVGMAASANDAIAVGILRRGAVALARAATVVAVALGLSDGPVYLAGGTFEQLPGLVADVRAELRAMLPRAAIETVREEPAMGAARLAARLAWGA